VLFQKAKTVVINDQLSNIFKEMREALLAAVDPKGVGLAAPQIGYPLKIFCIKPTSQSPITFYINPQIINQAKEYVKSADSNVPLEGCLSIPNTWGTVKRKKNITLKYQNEKGITKIQNFTGFPAVIIQHEMDHLDGILFTYRIIEQRGKLYEIVKDDEGKESLKELPL
jgi:peptide deformylase